MIDYSLDPNPDADDDKNAPPQKLRSRSPPPMSSFSAGDSDFSPTNLRENKLAAIGILPKRYAELERITVYVSSIVITPIAKNNG